jgi:hypothetical protein
MEIISVGGREIWNYCGVTGGVEFDGRIEGMKSDRKFWRIWRETIGNETVSDSKLLQKAIELDHNGNSDWTFH